MAQYRLNLRSAALQQAQTALNDYSVCYPNQRGFTPPNEREWLKLSLIFPRQPFLQGLSVRDRVDYILQVDAYLPKGTSDIEAYNIADILDSNFPINGTPIVFNSQSIFVKYVGSPRPIPISGEDDAWDRYVIDIGMYAFVDRT